MNRYLKLLRRSAEVNGFTTEVWGTKSILSKGALGEGLQKYLGYIDQYLLFPIILRYRIKKQPKECFYVVIDQALGLWMPFIKDKKHVVHCHDFIAYESSKGNFIQNRSRWSGRIYQKLIRKGFSQAKNFICISKQTRKDLLEILPKAPESCFQIYNAVDPVFKPGDIKTARRELQKKIENDLSRGYILHVGGNQFYKNREGVLAIYKAYTEIEKDPLPLIFAGEPPSSQLSKKIDSLFDDHKIQFLVHLSESDLVFAYQGASMLLYPSIMEGFGYPIIEALACGCPVLTTEKAPMTEVGGLASFYIPPLNSEYEIIRWARESVNQVLNILNIKLEDRKTLIKKNKQHLRIFQLDKFSNKIIWAYQKLWTSNENNLR